MNKFAAILGASALVLSTSAMAKVEFADPVPNVRGEDATTGGIGYEWTVTLGAHETAEIVGSTGGKGTYEPTFTAPNIGWTHTTDWVALDLTADAVVEIQVSRQEGVYEKTVDRTDPTIQGYATSGAMLYPAMSVYTGWDDTSTESAGFNPMGDFWAEGLSFKAVEYSKFGETTITYRAMLKAGHYSINIGGANALYCAETDECFNGAHGFKATFKASHVPGMQM